MSGTLSRRELISGAGIGAAALLLDPRGFEGQTRRAGPSSFSPNSAGIGRRAAALAQSGLRCVFAESIRDSENVAGPMSPDGLARSETPRFSAKLRDEGLAARE